MPYIGNTIRAADDYRLIDDISSSFNGSTTSFALQVAGSAPVPFPKSPQQVLISVNGVIQEPDPTGASGFNLVGTNIVFSSAPTNGHAFFGIIYATADYLNAGGNFPSGSTGAPSLTFIGDEDTGIYRKGSGSIGFVSNSTEIANTDSNGITISSGNLIIPDKIIHNGDTNTAIRFPAADTVSIETAGSERLRIDDNGRLLYGHTSNLTGSTLQWFLGIGGAAADFYVASNNDQPAYLNIHKTRSSTPGGNTILQDGDKIGELRFRGNTGAGYVNGAVIQAIVNGTPGSGNDLPTDLVFRLQPDGSGNTIERQRIGSDGKHTFAGALFPSADSTHDIGSSSVRWTNGYFDNLYGDGSNLTGINTDLVSDTSPQLGGDLDTNSFEITLDDAHKIKFGDGNDLTIQHSGNHAFIDNLTGNIYIRNDGSNDDSEIHIMARNDEESIVCHDDGAVDLYHNGSKRLETTGAGVLVSGSLTADGGNAITLGDTKKIVLGTGSDFEIFHNGASNNTEVNHKTNTGHLQITGNRLKLMNYDGPETYIDCISNGAVELYYDNSKKLETLSTGVTVTGRINSSSFGSQGAYSGQFGRIRVGADTHGNVIRLITDTNLNLASNNTIAFYIGGATDGSSFGTGIAYFHSGGLLPAASNTFDLGSTSLRWANVYTNDLNLSNEGSSNDVDSTWGDYTIQEGFEDLFLINNRTGKKFKFNLTEVS